jgi:uncharacterized membrane protein YebE (DUF533 family)
MSVRRKSAMFDAKSLLESILRGPTQSQPPSRPSNDPTAELSDLLRQFTQSAPQRSPAPAPRTDPVPRQSPAPDSTYRNAPYADEPYRDAPSPETGPSTDSLNDLWDQLFPNAEPPQGYQAAVGGTPSQSPPNPLDMLGQIFGQATQGAREGAGKVGQAAGLEEIIKQMSGGRSAGELLDQARKYMAENQLGTGAALGGLGALILGTQTGRSVAMSAAKLGAIALIGGLAYKAYQNYQQGRPLISGSNAAEPAPTGTGFAPTEVSHGDALNMIRGMIAAAAADGRLDSTEQQKIVGNLANTGHGADAEEFLAREMNAPASVEELAASVNNEQQALKLYTAARIAIDPDTTAEQGFLYQLGSRLGIDEELMAHVDAQARAAA